MRLTVRTTIEPEKLLEVTEEEYNDLRALGLLLDSPNPEEDEAPRKNKKDSE